MATTPEPPEPDPITEALIGDDFLVPDVAMLEGHLGRAPSPGRWRLYVTPGLDEYIEIEEAEIRYTRKLPNDGGTQVWVSREVAERRMGESLASQAARFLAGPIAERELAAAAAPSGASPAGTRTCASMCNCRLSFSGTVEWNLTPGS
jgi:hypothetical protein